MVEPQFEGYAQHDSQEFLGFLLNRLHEDLKRVDERNYNIVDLCQGEFRSTLRCLICKNSSRKLDTFMFFAFPIDSAPNMTVPTSTPSLYGCLEAFEREELLVAEEWWDCPQCKGKMQSSKKLELWTLPEILVIHVKRFSSNNDKLETFVNFPVHDFDLSNHVANKTDPGKQLYELYAVINHRGTQRNGHYTSFIKLRDVNRWYEFDDSIVSPLEEEKVQSEYAYVLLYKKVKTDVSNGAEPCPEAVLSEDEQLSTQGMVIHGDERRLAAELVLQVERLRMECIYRHLLLLF
ncbi:hypothetical protein POM88_019974 [Heracleum sosnowskyi]|uniref:USP domain-containing protein n=1 Tax=Heracleum sosnowskyi TaxID=360622 RepID=A0AAD8IAN5_9APIA|nr:hypothetical protein POM88_019974 [Heracleum sosnowskyi]